MNCLVPRALAALLVGTAILLNASFARARPPMTDSTDVRISSQQEHETSVFVSPLNPNAVLVYSNKGTGGARVWTSIDGGLTWSSNGEFGGDPGAAIIGNSAYGTHGRFVALGLGGGGDAKVEAHYKNTPAASWTSVPVTEIGPTDKGHLWVDNSASSSSSLRYRLYAAWMVNLSDIAASTSADGGAQWSATWNIEHVPGSEPLNWSPNVQTGRTGRVYMIWAKMDGGSSPNAATTRSFGFSEMLTASPLEFQDESVVLNNGISDANPLVASDASSIPSMAVDKSDSNQDRLFVVWAQRITATRSDIKMMKGTASLPSGAVTWDTSNLITVNANTGSDVKHWWPWVTWDECTGMLAVVFMEQIGSNVNTRIAASENQGSTWTEAKVSDVAWNGAQSDGYDYIGIGSGDGRAFPGWSDNREGAFRPYTSPILLWGFTSVTHTVESLPENIFRLTVTGITNLRADASDTFVLTPPPGIPLVGSPQISISADGKTHTVTYTGPCVPSGQSWNYVLTSRRTGCIQSRSETRGFKVLYCVE